VYNHGKQFKIANDEDGSPIRGVFIRDSDGISDFEGECWPKESVWVDFLNENSQKYWQSLYSYDKFIGTNKLFGYWIDMNEPSVFSEDELTMPKKAVHLTKDNVRYDHKDLHNAYGILMAKASY
jgi:mannosyl-oligosaccharide alpha-1,3-glucosidase